MRPLPHISTANKMATKLDIGQEKSTQATSEPGSSLEKNTNTSAVPANNTLPAPTQDRANLVDLAVKFLSNPRVADSPMEQKRAFLKKKGLTESEIEQAVRTAGVTSGPVVSGSYAPPPVPARTLTPHRTSWREYALMAAVVGGVGYTLYQFVKKFVLPWFEGRGQVEQRLADIQSSVEQLETNIRDMVTSLNQSTNTLRDLLSEQQRHIQLLSGQVTGLQSSVGQTSGTPLREIKDDVSTLKGLLLSRHQFPPTPTRGSGPTSGIPQWQRATPTKSNGTMSGESSDDSSPETVDKSALNNGGGEPVLNNGGGEPHTEPVEEEGN